MRKVQTEPKIEITLRSVDEAIHIQRLHVRNIGLGPALQVTFRPKVLAGDEGAQSLINELTQTHFFTSGISYLGEPPRVCRRLQPLRGWSDEDSNEIFP